MIAEQIWIGLVRGAYYLPIALGFALVARHGKYLPLWLPECGMISGYTAYFLLERVEMPAPLAVALALISGSACALMLHFILFAGHIARNEPFAALLRSIGVIVLLDNAASLLTGGYSLAFTRLLLPSNHGPIVLGGGALLAVILWALVNHTRVGLGYRSVSANRELAIQYGLLVSRIDLLVVFGGGLLCSLGGLANGIRYGLTAGMMSTTGLKAVAVVVAAGQENLLTVAMGVLLIGILESLCQGSIRFSAFEPGVSYGVLAVGLAGRYLLSPWWTRRNVRKSWRADSPEPEGAG
jgi:branched-chain amino acid transport system permease protein